MNRNLSHQQAIQEYQRELQKLETVKSVLEKKWDDMFASAPAWQKAGVKKQWDEWKAKTQEDMDRVKLLIENSKEQIAKHTKETREAARAELDAWKAEALQAWEANGGDKKGFNEAWPQMEQERLKQMTMKALNKET